MSSFLNITKISHWLGAKTSPLLISGPCSAETEEQVFQTVREVASSGRVHAIRAGIWKPRTRPNSFEGVGEKGLTWLVHAGKEVNIPVATEVANAAHLESALKAGVDLVWIGARTTVNPFSVQEIADSLKGVNIPVLVKNPINPDINLWIGALERINQAGIQTLAAVHRGFSVYHDSVYRNLPMWEIPIELKRMFPDLEILCDPSHIAGKRDLIDFVSQKALDLNMDGLMIESHPDPDRAWSDSKQQVTPEHLHDIVSDLQIRKPSSTDVLFKTKLDELRAIIDEIDSEIIHNFIARANQVKKIGAYKKDNEVTILQLERWKEILETRTEWARESALSSTFVQDFLNLIHQESIRIQTSIMNNEELKAADE